VSIIRKLQPAVSDDELLQRLARDFDSLQNPQGDRFGLVTHGMPGIPREIIISSRMRGWMNEADVWIVRFIDDWHNVEARDCHLPHICTEMWSDDVEFIHQLRDLLRVERTKQINLEKHKTDSLK
jgi:hypothetical protein